MVQEADYSAKVFVQSSIPRSWHEMEYQCRSSGGHLVSFDTQVSLISKENKGRFLMSSASHQPVCLWQSLKFECRIFVLTLLYIFLNFLN